MAKKKSTLPAPTRKAYQSKATLTAADVIAHTLARGATTSAPPPSPEALVELKQIVTHNDSASVGARVSQDVAIELLRSYGWTGKSYTALASVCTRLLGRRSYARA